METSDDLRTPHHRSQLPQSVTNLHVKQEVQDRRAYFDDKPSVVPYTEVSSAHAEQEGDSNIPGLSHALYNLETLLNKNVTSRASLLTSRVDDVKIKKPVVEIQSALEFTTPGWSTGVKAESRTDSTFPWGLESQLVGCKVDIREHELSKLDLEGYQHDNQLQINTVNRINASCLDAKNDAFDQHLGVSLPVAKSCTKGQESCHKIKVNAETQHQGESGINRYVDAFKTHINAEPNGKEHRCSECGYTTNIKGNFSRHVRLKHNANSVQYKCPECNFVSKHKASVKVHIERRHEGKVKIFNCAECNHTCKSVSSLKMHVDIHHNPDGNEYKCAECEYTSKCKQYLFRHWKTLHDVNAQIYKCKECDYTTKTKSKLSEHVKKKHASKAQESPLKFHVKRQRRVKTVIYRYVAASKHLKTYINAEHNTKEHKCSECSYMTNDKSNFSRHLRVKHNVNRKVHRNVRRNPEVKKFKCAECGYTTKSNQRFFHHRKHTHGLSAEEFSCTECRYKTKHKRNFRRHVRVKHHVTAEEYKCDECNFTSKCKGSFGVHIQTHEG